MIKAVIMRLDDDSDYPQICKNKKDKPLPHAEWYEYEKDEQCNPQVIVNYKQEARLNEEGKPYIHSWNELVYEPSWADWQKEGTDHFQRILDVGTLSLNMLYNRYLFTRKVIKGCWIISYDSIAELCRDMVKYEAVLSHDHEYIPGISYTLEINE